MTTPHPPNTQSQEREVMNAVEAADFLRLSEDAFRKLAPSLPRVALYGRFGYRYLRGDLLDWLRGRTDFGNVAETGPHLRALDGTKAKRKAPERGVKRLI